MERMNLFDRKEESSEASFGDTKPKKKTYTNDFKKKAVNLAFEIGATKAAEELGISTSSIYSWQKTLAKSSTPIQDGNGNLTFTLEGKTYSLNVNSEEERERVKTEVNTNSLAKYEWFKEETGKRHWVLYNTEMYEIKDFVSLYLHYKEDSNLIPIIPINATSCYSMFKDCSRLITLDIRNFDTSGVIDMHYMFKNCSKLTSLDFTGFNTSNATDMSEMFCNCESLTQLDLSNFDTSKVTDMGGMFTYCTELTNIFISNKWNTNRVDSSRDMFAKCRSLSNFNRGKTGIEMAKPVEQGGYLTLKK